MDSDSIILNNDDMGFNSILIPNSGVWKPNIDRLSLETTGYSGNKSTEPNPPDGRHSYPEQFFKPHGRGERVTSNKFSERPTRMLHASTEFSECNAEDPVDEHESALYQLAILQLDLYRIETERTGDRLGRSHEPQVDKVNQATGTLLDILARLWPQDVVSNAQNLPTPTAKFSDRLVQQDGPTTARSAAEDIKKRDISTILAVVACYLRLLEVYNHILSGNRDRLDSHISVGSFNLPGMHDLNISMQLHLISQMLRRIQDFILAGFHACCQSWPDCSTGSSPCLHRNAGEEANLPHIRNSEVVQASRSMLFNPVTSALQASIEEIRERERRLADLIQSLKATL